MRLVLHAPTAGALTRARSNLRNLLAAEPTAEVRIVANADAVPTAIDVPDPDTDGFLRLCENTLTARGLVAPPGIATVPAAVLEIVRLQADGWGYLRA